METKKTTLVAVLPSCLLITNSELFVKSSLESLTMQFRLLNSLMASSPILSHPKQSEMHSRRISFMLLQRRKHLFSNMPIVYGASSLRGVMKTGLWRTEKGFYGQMRPKSIELGQMKRSISGNKGENHWKWWMASSTFSKITTPNTCLDWLHSGLRTMTFKFLAGLPNPLT
jgi:hypothetical protein